MMNELTATTQNESVIETENRAKVFATFFAWWRPDLPKTLSYKYWRDVHAVWAARTPGFYQYRQLHLDYVDATLLSDLEGIETDLPKVDQPNGIAHIAYSSSFIANLLRKPFALKRADEDDAIFVSRNTYQRALLPVSQTYVDKANSPETNGLVTHPRYVLALKKRKGISEEDFSHFLVHQLCEPWRHRDDVQRLRLEILTPHVDAPTSPYGVAHSWDADKQYQAWIELGFSEGATLSSFFAHSAELGRYITAVHAYPIREIYTIVFGGKPTLVGLRGYPAAMLIEETGAAFQKSKQVLQFTYGSAINGGKLINQTVYVILMAAVIIIGMLFYFL